MLLFIYVLINNCCSESSGQAHLAVSAKNHSLHVSANSDVFMTRDILHFTYYFQHVNITQSSDTVYIIAIRVLDELANHSRTLTSDSSKFAARGSYHAVVITCNTGTYL